MRLRDVLHPYLDGITLVTESHEGSLSMRAYLDLPPGVAYERRGGKGDVRAADRESGHPAGQVLELAMFGPDPVLHGPESDALDAIRRLEPGDRSMILFGYETHALPFHRLLDDLTAAHAQVVQVSALEYDHIHAAAIVTAGDRLEIPRDLLGEPLAPDEDRELGDPVFVRIANEFVFTEFVSRNLRAQLYRIEFEVRVGRRTRPWSRRIATSSRQGPRWTRRRRRPHERGRRRNRRGRTPAGSPARRPTSSARRSSRPRAAVGGSRACHGPWCASGGRAAITGRVPPHPLPRPPTDVSAARLRTVRRGRRGSPPIPAPVGQGTASSWSTAAWPSRHGRGRSCSGSSADPPPMRSPRTPSSIASPRMTPS